MTQKGTGKQDSGGERTLPLGGSEERISMRRYQMGDAISPYGNC
jgi:uncharacterized protein (DUF58 family)